MVIIDAVTRLLSGVLDDESSQDESFSEGLLEYPQYTRPAEFQGMKALEVLLSGNYAAMSSGGGNRPNCEPSNDAPTCCRKTI